MHRTRHLFIRQQTSVINVIRAHLAEFGTVAPVGRNGVERLLGVAADSSDKRLPDVARACVVALGAQPLPTRSRPHMTQSLPSHKKAPARQRQG